MKTRDVLIDLAAGMFIAAVMCVCTSLYLTTMASHGISPAVHSSSTENVIDNTDGSDTSSVNLVGVWSVRR